MRRSSRALSSRRWAKAEMSDSTSLKASTSQAFAEAQVDLAVEKKGPAEDTIYLKELKRDCQSRAESFEVETKDNNAELTAPGKTKATLLNKFAAFVQTGTKAASADSNDSDQDARCGAQVDRATRSAASQDRAHSARLPRGLGPLRQHPRHGGGHDREAVPGGRRGGHPEGGRIVDCEASKVTKEDKELTASLEEDTKGCDVEAVSEDYAIKESKENIEELTATVAGWHPGRFAPRGRRHPGASDPRRRRG